MKLIAEKGKPDLRKRKRRKD